ncbi:MAG: type II secretion system protein [Deltaproteobacteria bacterium]|nr:type II secretion system protein [Deltaproteobacteria bacterium]
MQMWRAGTFKISGQWSGVSKDQWSVVSGQQRSVVSGQWSGVSGQLTGHRSPTTDHWQLGFTLIELLVVLSILSITLSFVIPRIIGREEAELKSAARKLLYTVRRLSDEAVFKKERQALNLDMDNNEYSKGDDGKRTKLPPGISLDHLQIGKEEIKKGTTSITIFPSGFRDEAMIHLTGKEKGKGYTIVIPALGERFEIRED